ncbi:hypothetical protein GCM10022226_32520 [Sphaerisporangium flaviroseum]|uniref:Uncharacterized protein n=1 Tax=Sphaerisporangium flaviroseum TaxID=509199 RepID=A0ABP7I3A0_9ACTN
MTTGEGSAEMKANIKNITAAMAGTASADTTHALVAGQVTCLTHTPAVQRGNTPWG